MWTANDSASPCRWRISSGAIRTRNLIHKVTSGEDLGPVTVTKGEVSRRRDTIECAVQEGIPIRDALFHTGQALTTCPINRCSANHPFFACRSNKPDGNEPTHEWHEACNSRTNVRAVAAVTGKSDMKIGYQRSNDTRQSKPLFVVLSKFETCNFPVPVRYLRLGQTKPSRKSSVVSRRQRRPIRERQTQGKTYSVKSNPGPERQTMNCDVPRRGFYDRRPDWMEY